MIKPLLRRGLVIGCAALTWPAWWPVLFLRRISPAKSDDAFRAGSEAVGLIPGVLGMYLRRGYYLMTLPKFSADCQIAFGTVFSQSDVRIGREVVIGRYCTIGRAELLDGTALGSNVDILSGRRQHATSGDSPVQYRAGTYERMRIGPGAWLGNSCVIMSHVGEEAVVGAAAVVVKEVPPGTVAVGNPARVVKQKSEPKLRVA